MESDSEFERRQEEEAAREAAHIGGDPGSDDDPTPPGISSDPARRPVEEAGGGEAEGFEIAEAELVDRAENPRGPSPFADRERISEDDRAVNEYGESDEVRTSEDDPEDPNSNW
jgi:hypothetical protein